MNWIQYPITLEGQRVKLVSLDSSHFPALLEVGKQKNIWQFMALDGSDPEKLLTHLKSTTLKRATGEQYPFTVIDKVNNEIIGSTIFHNIFPEHRKLEIGYTWYDPSYWATGYNTECKLLLLTHCFETLKTVRVQFQTSDKNLRSQAAIQKIGGKLEGTMRKERRRDDGSYRNTLMFSVIDDEWNEVKQHLHGMLAITTP